MQAFIQILPLLISFLNQLNLPGSLPLLDSFLSRNCRLHGGMEFIPNQQVNQVALREAVRKIVLVLPDAFHEVGSHAQVQRSVAPAGKNVDAGLFHDYGCQLSPG